MSIRADDFDREEYNTQLLEQIRDLIALLCERFEDVHETNITLDDIEDLEDGF